MSVAPEIPFSPGYKIGVEIAEVYTEEEINQLTLAIKESLSAVDDFLSGKTSTVFKGLRIRVGEGVAAGGGEALPDQNMIVLNGRAMLLSLSEMRQAAGYESNELRGSIIPEDLVGGALRYTLVHEMGHILDESTDYGDKRHRVDASESPTKYGMLPDRWNNEKDHEAFAEGFAHMVYKMPVSDTLADVIQKTIEARIIEAKI